MARAASPDVVVLGSRRKARLEAIVRRASAPQALVRRARIVLLAHAGWPDQRIAAELGCVVNTVRTWRRRFARGGMPALPDRPRSGRPEVYGPGVRLRIVAAATSVPPAGVSARAHALIAGQLAACCGAASSPPAPTSSTRSPTSRSDTPGLPAPGNGPTTPAPTTRPISPAAPRTAVPQPPSPPRPEPHDQHETGTPNPSRTYAALH
ncbi:MAG: helix-turn-helix domain-containing protein [Streptosporangiaceae bacterium]